MPLIRATLFFEQEGYGWSEGYWLNGANPDLRSYGAVVDRLAQKRIWLSGGNTRLRYSRWSEEGVFRDSFGATYPGLGLRGDPAQESDEPNTALLTRFRDPTGRHLKNLYLRGVWDLVVKEGGVYTPTPAYTARFDDFRAQLIQDLWGWRGSTSKIQALITNVAQDASGTVTITTGSNVFAGPFPQLAQVRVAEVLGSTEINGVLVGRANSATTFQTKNRISIFPYLSGGRLTFNVYGHILIDIALVSRVANRKVGRPSYKSVGRR